MTDFINQAAEEYFGITADPGDVHKLLAYLSNTYGDLTPEVLKNAFFSGEAADFLTVNETYFFREPAHFSLLWDILPAYEKTGIQICSAASSSGCEAYSIAMLMEAYNKDAQNPLRYHIDAFDLNPKMIEAAKHGVYGSRALREDGSGFHYMAEPYLKKTDDGYAVAGCLKKNMHFFVHNLMEELPQAGYDIIFFRNALIYFLPQNRAGILSHLTSALNGEGILILGVSETSGVCHACLENKNRGDVFYFQKTLSASKAAGVPKAYTESSAAHPFARTLYAAESPQKASPEPPKKELRFDVSKAGDILACEKSAAEHAERVRRVLQQGGDIPDAPDGSECIAAAAHFLRQEDFSGAGSVLLYMEKLDDSPITAFLRGEYYFLQDIFAEAEFYYKIAFSKDDAFWPASYRLCFLSSVGVLKKYRAEKSLEGLQNEREKHYEALLGGFSPDYYENVLSQKINLELCAAENSDVRY